jgi:hypothetical protein
MEIKFKTLILNLVIIATTVLSFSVFNVSAQVSPNSISVDVLPSNPAPGENTTILLSSYGTNLDSVSISWFVGGKKISSGVGMRSFSTQAPNAGSETNVRAVLSLPDGEIQKNIVIRPNIIVLLWQAKDSYVPPFYKGKAMPTAESEIKVVAMPEIKKGGGMINSKDLLYYWKLNYTNDSANSGYAKNSFTYINDYLENSENVAVSVSTVDGQYSSEANLNITPSFPRILFYKKDVNLGIVWDQILNNGYKIVDTETIAAEPYFISPKERWSPSLVWNWYINGNLTNNTLPYQENLMPLKVEGGISGTSTLRLDIENKNNFMGKATNEISLEF